MTKPRFRLAFLLGLAGASLLPTAGYAQDEQAPEALQTPDLEHMALAQGVIDQAFPEEARTALFQESSELMQAQMTQTLANLVKDAGAIEILTAWQEAINVESSAILQRNIPMLMDGMATAYADTFSKKELADILEFVSTPSGQAFMLRSTDVLSHPAFAAANQTYIDESMELVISNLPDLIEDLSVYEDSKKPAQD